MKGEGQAGTHLFLVSTPLHLLVSMAIVDVEKINNAHLVFIDQVAGKANPYLDALKAWSDSPFLSMAVFYRPVKSPLSKRKQRKNTFVQLGKMIDSLKPEHIYVGNDRRIEFQFCMQASQSLSIPVKGYYLDEGMFTYVGRKASNSFSDRVIDNLLKKISYGFWWKHPPTVGGSDWVQTVYASYPELIHPLLKQKQVRHLTLDYWQSPILIRFCEKLVQHIGCDLTLSDYDLILTLPHESILHSHKWFAEKIHSLIEDQLERGDGRIGVKYHPRDTDPDSLKLGGKDRVDLIPLQLPFEAILPMLRQGASVYGDFSTTLLTSRLLRPDLKVQALTQADENNTIYADLYQNLGIKLLQE